MAIICNYALVAMANVQASAWMFKWIKMGASTHSGAFEWLVFMLNPIFLRGSGVPCWDIHLKLTMDILRSRTAARHLTPVDGSPHWLKWTRLPAKKEAHLRPIPLNNIRQLSQKCLAFLLLLLVGPEKPPAVLQRSTPTNGLGGSRSSWNESFSGFMVVGKYSAGSSI